MPKLTTTHEFYRFLPSFFAVNYIFRENLRKITAQAAKFDIFRENKEKSMKITE